MADESDSDGQVSRPRRAGPGLNPLFTDPATGLRRGGPGRKKGTKVENAKKRERHPKLTDENIERFLSNLQECAMVRSAANRAGVSLLSLYRLRAKDSDFAKRWQDSLQIGYIALEDELIRRAYKGVEEPVFYKGEQVTTVTKYSDSLLQFALKAVMPEKYREPKAEDAEQDKTGYVLITKDDERL